MFQTFPDLVDFRTMCMMLNCGKTKGYELLKANKIPYKKNGPKYLIKKADLINYIEKLPG